MFVLYTNKQARVELTETTYSTATIWLYTNRQCCTDMRFVIGDCVLYSRSSHTHFESGLCDMAHFNTSFSRMNSKRMTNSSRSVMRTVLYFSHTYFDLILPIPSGYSLCFESLCYEHNSYNLPIPTIYHISYSLPIIQRVYL